MKFQIEFGVRAPKYKGWYFSRGLSEVDSSLLAIYCSSIIFPLF